MAGALAWTARNGWLNMETATLVRVLLYAGLYLTDAPWAELFLPLEQA